MTRRGKYNSATVAKIVEAIRETGCDETGWLAGGISPSTYWQWLKDYSDFSESISQAKAEYRNICPEELIRAANVAFANLLRGEAQQVTEVDEEFVAADGSVSTKKTVKKVRLPVPKWAIERVLGAPTNASLDAIEVLADQEVQGSEDTSDLQITSRAIADLLRSWHSEDPHSLPALTSALVKLLEYRRKINPATAAEAIEAMLDHGYSPATIVEELKAQWFNRPSLSPPPGAENN